MTEAWASRDHLTSWHAFEGDEEVPDQDYRASMLSRYYQLAPATITAATAYGLRLDTETGERWKRVAVGAGLLDAFLDDMPLEQRDQAQELYQQGIAHVRGRAERPDMPAWADPLLGPAVTLLHNAVQPLAAERKAPMFDAAERIGQINPLKAACSSVEAYVGLLREEGRLSGELMTAAASDSVYALPGYGVFARFFEQTMVAGTLADSAIDLPVDYQSKLTGVAPTRGNRLRVAAHGLAPAVRALRVPGAVRAGRAGLQEWRKQKSNQS
jgi:hypothetical protein